MHGVRPGLLASCLQLANLWMLWMQWDPWRRGWHPVRCFVPITQASCRNSGTAPFMPVGCARSVVVAAARSPARNKPVITIMSCLQRCNSMLSPLHHAAQLRQVFQVALTMQSSTHHAAVLGAQASSASTGKHAAVLCQQACAALVAGATACGRRVALKP
jgi:hypothetical protein